MNRLYEIWFAYVMFIVNALLAFARSMEHLPFIVPFGSLILVLGAVDLFLPRWAALSIYATTLLPLVSFLCTMFYVYFTHYDFSGRPRHR
jgi:hypothetical protein